MTRHISDVEGSCPAFDTTAGSAQREASTSHGAAYIVWGVAVLVYTVAIAGRTSFGVAGLLAMDRFDISAGTLSLFTVIQLATYAGAQIPVGMLLDRVGPRVVLTGGALLMAGGQVLLGCADSLGLALAARFLIGAGDATAFSSAIRLVAGWFPARKIPLYTQLTGIVGALGQLISSVPFAFALNRIGWTFAFCCLAVAGASTALIAWFVIRREPPAQDAVRRETDVPGVLVLARTAPGPTPSVRATLGEPGTRLAFWTHFSTCCQTVVFPLLWGVPYLEVVGGWSAAAASGVLIVQTIAGLPAGPLVARFVSQHPLRRSWVVMIAIVVTIVVWTAVLLWPGTTPVWLVALLMAVHGFAGAASSVAFDFARTSVDPRRLSTATGIANMGGFVAALLVSWLIGFLLDIQAAGGAYEPIHYRIAMISQLVVIALGTIGIVYYKRATRVQMREEQGVVVPPIREAYVRWKQTH